MGIQRLIGQIRAVAVSTAVFIVALAFFTPVAYAVTSLSESYSSPDDLAIGSLVSVRDDQTDIVEAAESSNSENLLGVVIASGSSLLTLSNGKDDEVQVATTGTLPVLVSDINGEIKRGNHVTASPIKGVGMLASANVRVIGVAQGGMTNSKEETYKNAQGEEKKVRIGQVPVLVNVAYYFKEPEKTVVPAAIQSVANSLAGREVGTVAILISGGIFLIMLIIVASLVYSMIRSSIISVGRNPLSQSAIYRDLIQLSGLVLAILGVGLVSIYLVLTKL
ncbi:hypothetical protein H7142_01035 [Candidatus Saccharibacteria bacterium]|nr:hypothetical protein [Candidatus Saccharibacteria bacterium]